MVKLISNLVVQVASYASIYGLYFALAPPGVSRPEWHWGLLGLGLFALIFFIVREVKDYSESRPRIYKTESQINSYMSKWVASRGRIAILSRDLSWADAPDVKDVLLNKAKRKELTICVRDAIPFTNELKDNGAEIVTYRNLKSTPLSRFTIVGFGQAGARVAIGVDVEAIT